MAKTKLRQYNVAVAAEAAAATLFARCGLDVSIQYGANQPGYDLAVIRGPKLLKVSVKGSQDGGWGVTQSYLKKGTHDYYGAIKSWLERHADIILCYVQFKDVPLDQMPRVYLARPSEVATWLREAASKRGDTILWETHAWSSRAFAAGTTDRIPEAWRFSLERVSRFLEEA